MRGGVPLVIERERLPLFCIHGIEDGSERFALAVRCGVGAHDVQPVRCRRPTDLRIESRCRPTATSDHVGVELCDDGVDGYRRMIREVLRAEQTFFLAYVPD